MEHQDQQHLSLAIGKCAQPGAMALFSRSTSSWCSGWPGSEAGRCGGNIFCWLPPPLKIDSVKNLQDEAGTLASFRPGVLNRIDGGYGKLLRLKARPGASQ